MKVKQLLTCLLTLLGSIAAHAYDFELNGVYYNITDADAKTVEVTYVENGEGNADFYYGSIVIPKRVSKEGVTYLVTAIGNYAFTHCSGVTSVNIGDNVTSIGSNAFNGCTGITSIVLPDAVTSIGGYAFQGCTNLLSVTMPANVVQFGGLYAFDSNNNIESVYIKDLEKWLAISFMYGNNPLRCGAKLYLNGEELTHLVVPNGISEILTAAFEGCESLNSVVIPSTVATINDYAFYGCSNLESVSVWYNSPTSISSSTFSNQSNATLYVPAGAKMEYEDANYWKLFNIIEYIRFDDSNVKALCVQNWDTNGDGELSEDEAAAVTSLGVVFKGNTEITSFNELQYFTGLTEIPREAFMNCTSLASVVIPDNITSIGYSAFDNCYALASINLPSTITNIDGAAFSDCRSLTGITLPEGIPSIGDWFFDNCTGLTEVVIPESVTTIGRNAFSGCTALNSIRIPSDVSSIGYGAFSNCPNVTSIVVAEGNTTYDSRNNCNAIIETATNKLIKGCNNTVIPSDVASIGNEAFYYCTGLTSVSLPEGLTFIDSSAFRSCTALTEITIPASVTSIGSYAFEECTCLTSVTALMQTPVTISSDVFSNRAYATLTVPFPTKYLYEAADYWKEFKEIVQMEGPVAIGDTFPAPVSCGEATTDLTFKVTNVSPLEVEVMSSPEDIAGSVTIPATVAYNGLLFAVKTIGERAFRERNGITSVTIEEGIESIYGWAFELCENNVSVTLPESVKRIAGAAFAYNTKLEIINIPSQMTEIEAWVFARSDALKTITLPESITIIKESAFRESGLESIKFPTTLTEIGENAFHSCSSLKTIDFNDASIRMNAQVFWGCTSLEDVYIPKNVKLIGWSFFRDCTSLKTVVFEAKEDNNGWEPVSLFFGCNALESVVVPFTSMMGNSWFNGCSSLKSVTFLRDDAPANNSRNYANNFQGVPDDVLFIIPEGTAENFLLRGYKNLSDKSGLPLVREEFEAEAARLATMADAATNGDKASLTAAVNAARSTVNSTDDYMTVYAQIAAIKTAAKTFMTTATLPENFDVTAATVTNPDFDRLDIGWKVPYIGDDNGYFVGEKSKYTNGDVTIDHFIEVWKQTPSNLSNGQIAQTIKKLPTGVYRLEADMIATLQSDASAEVTGVNLFAGNAKVAVATEIEKPQHFSVKFENATTRDVTIGIDVNGTNANWVAMDNVRLIYESKAAAIPAGAELKSSETDTLYLYNVDADKYLSAGHAWSTHAILDETGLPIRLTQNEETGLWQIYFWEGAADQKLLFQEELDQSEAHDQNEDTWVDYHGDHGKAWWNITQASDGTLLIQIEGAAADKYLGNDPEKQDYRIGGYNGYTYTDVNAYVSADKNVHWILFSKAACDMIIAKRKLMDTILRMEASGMTDGATLLSTAKTVYENDDATIKEVIDITTLLNSQMGMPKLNEPIDMTALITNPRFENNTTEGWSGANVVGGRSDATSNQEQEFFEKDFNMYQVITGVPNGRYMLKWKGFHRPGQSETVYNEYIAGTNNASVVVYANEVQKTMKHIASEMSETQLNGGDREFGGKYFPYNMEGTRLYFDAGFYADQLEVEVTDNVLTIGIKNTQPMSTDHWVIFSDFEVYILENEEQLYHKLSGEDVKCVPGVPFTYNINLTNRDEVTAFQFEMTLPEGVSIYEENGQQEVQLANRGNGHMFSCKKQGKGNTYLFSALSLQSKAFKRNSGALVRMTLQSTEDTELGDYEIKVKNVELSKPNGMQVLPFDFTTTLTVKEADPGDVNGDGMITVTDAVYVFRYVNGEVMPYFQRKATDVNGDKQITINDAMGIVNMILGTGKTQNARVLKRLKIPKLAEGRATF